MKASWIRLLTVSLVVSWEFTAKASDNISSAVYEDAREVIGEVVEAEAARSTARVVSCASQDVLLPFFPGTLDKLYERTFDGIGGTARAESAMLSGAALRRAVLVALERADQHRVLKKRRESLIPLLSHDALELQVPDECVGGQRWSDKSRCLETPPPHPFETCVAEVDQEGGPKAFLVKHKIQNSLKIEFETCSEGRKSPSGAIACELGWAASHAILGQTESGRRALTRAALATLLALEPGAHSLSMSHLRDLGHFIENDFSIESNLRLVANPEVQRILSSKRQVFLGDRRIGLLELLPHVWGVNDEEQLLKGLSSLLPSPAANHLRVTCDDKKVEISWAPLGSVANEISSGCRAPIVALTQLAAAPRFSTNFLKVVSQSEPVAGSVLLTHAELFAKAQREDMSISDGLKWLAEVIDLVSADVRDHELKKKLITLEEFARADTLYALVNDAEHGDISSAVRDGINLVLRQEAAKDKELVLKYKRVFLALLPYLLNSDSAPSPALREELRKALTGLMLESGVGGYTTSGPLGFDLLTLSLRASFSSGYVGAEGTGFRVPASVEFVTFRLPPTYTRYFYGTFQISLFDLLGPLSEYALRNQEAYSEEELVLANFASARIDYVAASPVFTKRVALFAGVGFRPVSARASDYAYRFIGTDGSRWTQHLDLGLGLRFYPF